MGYKRRKQVLHETIRGWVGYFKLADMKTSLEVIDQWLRRRIRMCIWKAWKRPKTRFKNLIECGIKAVWSFATSHLEVPEGILVQYENMATSLAVLSMHLQAQMKEKK